MGASGAPAAMEVAAAAAAGIAPTGNTRGAISLAPDAHGPAERQWPAAAAETVPPPEAAPPPASTSGRSLWLSCVARLDALAADWHASDEYDRFYWTLATLVYASYMIKLVPRISWHETAQNAVMQFSITAMCVMSMWYPSLCRRHGALCRMLLLTYAYMMPVLCSLRVMHAFSPEPSSVPYLGYLVDTYSLWLSTRSAFLAWAAVGCRPPLYLAVPYQLFGLWRISNAGFCQAPVLQHPVMQERTELAHLLLSLTLLGMGGALPWRHLVPPTPGGRCSALLLFYNVLFAFLVPLLLLVPLRRQGGAGVGAGGAPPSGAARAARRSTALQRLDGWIEGWLRMLMLPEVEGPEADGGRGAAWGRRGGAAGEGRNHAVQQRRDAGPAAAAVLTTQAAVGTLLLRWWMLCAVLWTLCCIVAG